MRLCIEEDAGTAARHRFRVVQLLEMLRHGDHRHAVPQRLVHAIEAGRSDEDISVLEHVELREAVLDNTDDDGTPLNEESFKTNITASDLDIPGQNLDDENEFIGEEDEENNDYSQGADNDEIPQDEF